MLNSCYGFTLCNLTSSKFKTFKNLQSAPKHAQRKQRIVSCIELTEGVFLAEYKTSQRLVVALYIYPIAHELQVVPVISH